MRRVEGHFTKNEFQTFDGIVARATEGEWSTQRELGDWIRLIYERYMPDATICRALNRFYNRGLVTGTVKQPDPPLRVRGQYAYFPTEAGLDSYFLELVRRREEISGVVGEVVLSGSNFFEERQEQIEVLRAELSAPALDH